jgi:hypothetical protein
MRMRHSGYVSLLIKFVKEMGHAKSFLDGNLFCKPLNYFKGIEDEQRGDKLELAASKLQTEVYISSINLSYKFWLEVAEDQFTPIFCMYQVSSSSPLASIRLRLEDNDLRGFGDYGVVIWNTGEFINRLNHSLSEFSYALVDYIDYENLVGGNEFALKKPILQKDRKAFGYQREFRIYNTHYAITSQADIDLQGKEIIEPNKYGGAFFSIGNMTDIAETYTMDELFLGVELSVQNPIYKKILAKELWWNGTKYQEI